MEGKMARSLKENPLEVARVCFQKSIRIFQNELRNSASCI
jgi:hypothetical protein